MFTRCAGRFVNKECLGIFQNLHFCAKYFMRAAITTLVRVEGNGTGSRCYPLTARPTGGSFKTGGAEDRETKSFSKSLARQTSWNLSRHL